MRRLPRNRTNLTGACIRTTRELEELCTRLRGTPLLAIDTETNGLHAYRSRVCIIQLAVEEESWIIDVLAFRNPEKELEPLLDLLEDPVTLKLLHGSSHDVSSIKADFDRQITNIFDTHIAARLLQYEKNGLSDLVTRHFGVVLEKKHQTQNWAKRPLTPEDLDYLRRDVTYLPRLYRIMLDELAPLDLIEEVHLESRRVEETPTLEQDFNPEAFWQFKGIDHIGDRGLAFLKELHAIRDEIAERLNRPVFKVIANGRLVEMATAFEEKDMPAFRKLLPDRFHSYLPKFEEAWRQSLKTNRPVRPPRHAMRPDAARTRNGRGGGGMRREDRSRLEDILKKWRNEEAATRGVSTMAVLPNHLMEAIIVNAPASAEDLGRIPYFGTRRLERYAATILGLLAANDEAPASILAP